MSALDPLIVSVARRAAPSAEIRLITPGERGMIGTSAGGFVREYDGALAAHEAAVREQERATLASLVRSLQSLCDDELLRRRDRIMRLPGARYMRDSGAGEAEQAATRIRLLIEAMPGYDPIGSGGAYLTWIRTGRDGDEATR